MNHKNSLSAFIPSRTFDRKIRFEVQVSKKKLSWLDLFKRNEASLKCSWSVTLIFLLLRQWLVIIFWRKKSTLTAALKALLNIEPLHIHIERSEFAKNWKAINHARQSKICKRINTKNSRYFLSLSRKNLKRVTGILTGL